MRLLKDSRASRTILWTIALATRLAARLPTGALGSRCIGSPEEAFDSSFAFDEDESAERRGIHGVTLFTYFLKHQLVALPLK